MKSIAVLICFIFLSSCTYFEKKKVSSEDLLKEELQSFNWNEVDTYPTFSSCDSITIKADSKACFQNTLISHVNKYLEAQNIVVTRDINDTIVMQITIDKNGNLTTEDISINPKTTNQIPDIDSLLRQSLQNIPKIYPAIKRGQQVTTAFELPIIVAME